jgi:hypothetical protein
MGLTSRIKVKQTNLIEDRIEAIRRANPEEQLRLTAHQLERALDELAPQLLGDIGALRNGRRAGGRTLSRWVHIGAMKNLMAHRIRPAIGGFHALGHTAAATQLDQAFTDWERRCDALAASCPRAMPKDKEGHKRLIAEKTAEAEALLSGIVYIIGRHAQLAGIELQPNPGFKDVMLHLLHAREPATARTWPAQCRPGTFPTGRRSVALSTWNFSDRSTVSSP